MNYKSKEQIIELINSKNYKYVWINTYSDIYLKDISNSSAEEKENFLCDDLIEAKFFNDNEELSIMETDEEKMFSVAEFNVNEYEDYVEETQILSNYKLNNNMAKLIIRHYLKYDEDGQAYIAYTKLYKVEEEK